MPPAVKSDRAGKYDLQPGGFRAFIPAPLPPNPPLVFDAQMLCLHEDATLELGRLEGLTINLPNPDLFVSMYVRKEALLSSQIEGTQASLEDVLAYEVQPPESPATHDAAEVVNYVRAMTFGLKRRASLPLSLRLIREIHAELLRDVRGGEQAKTPGEFRTTQNWIGHPGCRLEEAAFVPPPPHEMEKALHDLEKYLHSKARLPVLVRCALVHAQFETIHPFIDGNGRVGRLLIAFLLCHQGVLRRPLLYLSYYFRSRRQEYYDRLNAVRTAGDWEGWLRFFLAGVAEVAHQASETAKRILGLCEQHTTVIRQAFPRAAGNALRFLDHLFDRPYVTVASVSQNLGVSLPTANNLTRRFQTLHILREITGQSYRRVFVYAPYLSLLREGTEP